MIGQRPAHRTGSRQIPRLLSRHLRTMDQTPILVDFVVGKQPFDRTGAAMGLHLLDLGDLFGNVYVHRTVAAE